MAAPSTARCSGVFPAASTPRGSAPNPRSCSTTSAAPRMHATCNSVRRRAPQSIRVAAPLPRSRPATDKISAASASSPPSSDVNAAPKQSSPVHPATASRDGGARVPRGACSEGPAACSAVASPSDRSPAGSPLSGAASSTDGFSSTVAALATALVAGFDAAPGRPPESLADRRARSASSPGYGLRLRVPREAGVCDRYSGAREGHEQRGCGGDSAPGWQRLSHEAEQRGWRTLLHLLVPVPNGGCGGGGLCALEDVGEGNRRRAARLLPRGRPRASGPRPAGHHVPHDGHSRPVEGRRPVNVGLQRLAGRRRVVEEQERHLHVTRPHGAVHRRPQ